MLIHVKVMQTQRKALLISRSIKVTTIPTVNSQETESHVTLILHG